MILRPYQAELVAGVRAAIAAGRKRILVVLPTGGGKTPVIAHVAQRFGAGGHRTLILAHRRELVRQASGKLGAINAPHGVILPGAEPDLSAPIQVGSVQTVARRLDRLPPARVVVLDEAHHAIAGQWRQVLDASPGALVLGVTATPERLDGRGLGDCFDVLVSGPTIPELVAGGYLAPCRVFGPPAPVDTTGVAESGGDYVLSDLAARMMAVPGVTGDAVAHYARLCPGVPAIAFCASVGHAETVAEAFRAGGWRAVAVSGSSPAAVRDAAIAGLGTGAVQVLCSCDLISEGLDVPAVGAVLLLRPTQSLGLFLQMVGRGMRPAAGKAWLAVLDHAGNTLRHGMPDAARVWSLDGAKTRARDVAFLATRQCRQCYAIHAPAPVCPCCGAFSAAGAGPRRLRTAEGELVEITADDWRLRTAPLRELVRESRTLQQLQAIGRARGYAPNWPEVTMAAKDRARARFRRG